MVRNQNMNAAWRHVDGALIGFVAATVAFGLAMIHSVTSHQDNPAQTVSKQAMFVMLGAGAMADVGLRGISPGANDNASGVAVLLELARSLARDPAEARVLLVGSGGEEGFDEDVLAPAWGVARGCDGAYARGE